MADGQDQGAGIRPARRPDESMTLLTEIMDRPLDPSYAAAAAARGDHPAPRRPWNTALVGVTAVAAGVVFVTSGLAHAQPGGHRGDARADLVSRIEEKRRAVEEQGARVTALRDDIRAVESGALARRGIDTAALTTLGVAAGDVAVEGPGMRVTLDDADGLAPAGDAAARAGGHDDTGRVVYRDLQQVTNELWAAGAEAVAVNGHRLTSTSAIRFAGPAILVDFRPLARPYVVDAIMGETQRHDFVAGPGGAYLDELRTAYSVKAEAHAQVRLTIPAADMTALRHARPAAPSGLPSGDTGPTGRAERKNDG